MGLTLNAPLPLPPGRRFTYRKSVEPVPVRDPLRESLASRATTNRVVTDQTFRTLVAEWDRKIHKTVKNLHLYDHIEDVKQDIYLYMSQRDPNTGKNGLESYDPTKGAFSSYMYRLVYLKALNYKNKLGRDRMTLTPMGYEVDLDMRALSLEPDEIDDRDEFWLQVEQIASDLEMTSAGDGFFDNTGCLITCDARSVMALLLEGHTRQEIVKMLRCSHSELNAIMKTLSQDPRLRELARSYIIDDNTPRSFNSPVVLASSLETPFALVLQPSHGVSLERKKMMLEQARQIVLKEQEVESKARELEHEKQGLEALHATFDQALEGIAGKPGLKTAAPAAPSGSSHLARITDLFKQNPDRRFEVVEVVKIMFDTAKAAKTTTLTYLTRLVKSQTIEKVGHQTYQLSAGQLPG